MRKIFILLAFLALILTETVLAYELTFKDKVYPGVKIASKPPLEPQITFSLQGRLATVSSQIRFQLDREASKKKARRVGRSGHLWADLRAKYEAFSQGIEVEPVYTFDLSGAREALQKLEKEIYQEPKDAQFLFRDGRVVAFQEEQPGQGLDIEGAIRQVKEKLALQEEKIKIELAPVPLKPKITTDQANDLGIREKLGRGVSTFRGSAASRVHNIVLAANRLNGLLVPPGEVFSFNQALGDISAATGYRSAYIIKEGKTILGDGGGVCQVSTTLFRAILDSGLPVVERHPHSYRVTFYEQNSPPGFDATVFAPQFDLKFKNDTPAHLLIQSQVDQKNKKLVFEFFGTSDGRHTTLTQPKVWDQTPPPPPLYQDDPTLPQGEVKQVDFAAWEAKVSFDWKVTRGEETLQERTFYSHYQPWQAVYLRGTGP